MALFLVKFAEVIQAKHEKTRNKTIEKTQIFLIYTRVEDRVSGLNDMAYSYMRYTHDKHANSDI